MTVNPELERRGLYYPFHLCHEQTLGRLLDRYASVHFRDYMALQLTPMTGLTAFMDRMGDRFPELVATGRIVQGYSLSGPLDDEISSEIDRDLADREWREMFHTALLEDRRFQRGLFDLSHAMRLGNSLVPGPSALLELTRADRSSTPYSVDGVKAMSAFFPTTGPAYEFEYGLALVKTSAAFAYTIRLASVHGLEAVTDSERHYRLLERTLQRDDQKLLNFFAYAKDAR